MDKRFIKEEKHHAWKGNAISYQGIHAWVRRTMGQPSHCEECRTTEKRRYEWANISGHYRRVSSDWKRLCVPCHSKLDKKTKITDEEVHRIRVFRAFGIKLEQLSQIYNISPKYVAAIANGHKRKEVAWR